MKAERYINVLGWMMDDLNLSGKELLIYALIYGFSQEAQGAYTGSQKELADWVHTQRPKAADILTKLTEKGLLVKEDYIDSNNNKRCLYRAVVLGVSPNGTCPQMGQRVSPNGTRGMSPNGTTTLYKDDNKDIYKSNQSIACARTREELVADARKEFRERAGAVGGSAYTKEMMDAFCDYWTEPFTNPVGRKLLRWQGEKTWDMAARLRTWASRDRQFAAKARPAFERPKLRPAIDLTFDYAENQRKICELGSIQDGEDCGYDH